MTMTPSGLDPQLKMNCTEDSGKDVEVETLIHFLLDEVALPDWLDEYADLAAQLKADEQFTAHRVASSQFAARAVLVVKPKNASRDAVRETARQLGIEHRSHTSFATSGLSNDRGLAIAFAEGLAQGRYRFARYRESLRVSPAELLFTGVAAGSADDFRNALAIAEVVEEGVRGARDLTNTPARDLTPDILAREASQRAKAAGATVRVFDEHWLEDEGFAGLTGVGSSSINPPRLIEVTYRSDDAADLAPIVLVGKGITFDSGGLSIKTAEQMVDMKSDMAGAAAALETVCAIARLRPAGMHVVALLAAAENLPGAEALRPGDIIRHRNGLTTEVVNTDCEGRLVMSDVLHWGSERAPRAMLDLATLTYATVHALGNEITSVLGTDSGLINTIQKSGARTGDHYWELPLWENYRPQVVSAFADLQNETVEDEAGAITAALFLRSFVGDTSWAHLDIGGTAYFEEGSDTHEPGATGVCVRSLTDMILHFDEPHGQETA